jgi:hypothetical protein
MVPPLPQPDAPRVQAILESERLLIGYTPRVDSLVYAYFIIPGWPYHPWRVSCAEHAIIRHQRFWRNVTSRLLGPGTTYSVSYTWSEGVEQTTGNDVLWTVAEEFELARRLGINVLAGTYTFDQTAANIVSEELTTRFSSSRTVSQFTETTEEQSVRGVDGMDRVYTVWQLVDEYDFIDDTDGSPTEGQRMDQVYHQRCDDYQRFREAADADAKFQGYAGVTRTIFPVSLQQGTQFFAQMTSDFPRNAAAAVTSGEPATTSVRYYRIMTR